MIRFQLPRLGRARLPLLGGILTMALLPMQIATRTIRADEQSNADPGKPNECDQLVDVPGHANGLHKHCGELGGGSGVARGDFNGDGIGDLAIGVPYENVGTATDAGAVHIIYGSATGLTATGNQFFTQDSTGVPNVAEKDDHFGGTLAAVDLNDDGFSDLAIGVPQEDTVEGLVQMLMGSAAGLVAGQVFTFNSLENSTCGCRFGSALAWGDFDRDGRGDLAIGMPRFVDQGFDLGEVMVRFGRGSHQIIENPLPADPYGGSPANFGLTLAAGDHDGDGYDDLAVGAPGYHAYIDCDPPDCQPEDWAGAVFLYTGTATGLLVSRVFFQDDAGGTIEEDDQFGRSLAFGDFDGDGSDELVVGAPFEHVSGSDVGAVSIFYDFQFYPIRLNRTFTQDDLGGANAEAGDLFGFALAAGDFDGDGHADLAIGAPGEDLGNPYQLVTFFQNAGVVHVLYGYANLGLPQNGEAEIWHQDTSGVPGLVETGDFFGASLSAWNFGKTSHRDLAIGVPYEDVSGKADAGAVVVLYGAASGLSASGAQIWHQDSPGIADVASTSDRFGSAMY